MSNLLSPGNGGLVSPSPKDEQATPPNPVGLPAPGPSAMQGHFTSAEDMAQAKLGKLETAWGQIEALRTALDKLTTLGDTVTMDDLVEASGDMIAKGVPAIQIASSLAEAPDQPSQLQAWVQQQSAALAPQEEKMKAMLKQAGYGLAQASMMSLVSHSAEEHYNRKRLAAMPVAGSA